MEMTRNGRKRREEGASKSNIRYPCDRQTVDAMQVSKTMPHNNTVLKLAKPSIHRFVIVSEPLHSSHAPEGISVTKRPTSPSGIDFLIIKIMKHSIMSPTWRWYTLSSNRCL